MSASYIMSGSPRVSNAQLNPLLVLLLNDTTTCPTLGKCASLGPAFKCFGLPPEGPSARHTTGKPRWSENFPTATLRPSPPASKVREYSPPSNDDDEEAEEAEDAAELAVLRAWAASEIRRACAR